MLGARGRFRAQSAKDPYWANVFAMLHMDGTNGSTTFVDSSPLAKTYSATSASLTTSTTKWGSAAGSFGSAGSVIASTTSVTSIATTDDYTVEGWFNFTDVTTTNVLILHGNFASAGYELYVTGGELNIYGGASGICGTSGLGLTTGVWYHIAVTRASGIWKIWVGGVLKATSGSTPISITGSFGIGLSSPYGYRGYADDVRATAGIARYTTTFTPPTAAFPDS